MLNSNSISYEMLNAITAIKEALAQPPRPMQECPNYEDCKGACFQCEYFNAETGMVEYPAQPEQEPWCMKMNGCKTKCEDCPDKPPEERNFCPRCGKRTADLTTIHTCTPPMENT
jgi:hypothetical protein